MKQFLYHSVLILLLSSCWPESFSFRDSGGMPVEWQSLSFAPLLTEKLKDGVQNNSRLLLNTNQGAGEVNIEGAITNYQVQPVAIQGADNASSNRLTMSLALKIKIKAPKEEEWQLVSTRFADFDAKSNLADVEQKLFAEIADQMVQDLINKLYSNW